MVVINRDTHIILKTPRLVIRQFTEDDVDNLFSLNSDPQVMRYLTGGRPTPREEIRDRIIPFHLSAYDRLDRLGTWAAESAATGEFLGWFHLRADPAPISPTSTWASGCGGPRGTRVMPPRGRGP